MKTVVMCVDDFGMKPEVDAAVADLVDARVVSATGCMSLGPAWRQDAALLRGSRRDRLDVGLHFNLTEPFTEDALALPLPQVIMRALAGALPRDRLMRSIRVQLDAFENVWGAPPDFVDGHQHVHQLPQVREALLGELLRRYSREPGGLPWLRFTRAPRPGPVPIKHRIIESLGSRGFERLARALGFRLNGALLGVYGFEDSAETYQQRLMGWLAEAREGDVLMMHPARGRTGGAAAPDRLDAIADAREVEYAVLLQNGGDLLAQKGVQAGRMSAISSILNR